MSTIEPAQKAGHDERTFECSSCPYAETTTVKFKVNAWSPKSEQGDETEKKKNDTLVRRLEMVSLWCAGQAIVQTIAEDADDHLSLWIVELC